MSATGTPRLTPVELRILLTAYKEQKRTYAPFVAGVQAALNEAFGAIGVIAYGIAGGRLTQTELTQFADAVRPELQSRLSVLGVTFDFTATAAGGGVDLSWSATKGANSDSGTHQIRGNVEDFSDDYLQSLNIAVNRFARWAATVTADVADRILDAASEGYQRFMTEGTPTAKQALAALKHKLRVAAVDRNLYVSQLQGSSTKYQNGYQSGATKYQVIGRWALDGILGATKATLSVLKVL